MPDTGLPFDMKGPTRSCWVNSAKCNITHSMVLSVYRANSLRFVGGSRQKCNRTSILMHCNEPGYRELFCLQPRQHPSQ